VTGLPNRAAFLEAVQPGMTAGPAAVLVIGLIRLQEIANTLGHGIADRVLRHTTLRLGRLLPDANIACLGGGTFAAFLPGTDEAGAQALAVAIVSHFESPYRNGDLAIDTVAAVGIALLPSHGEQPEPLLRRAEVAFQAALKSEGHWAFYDPATDPHTPERLSLMSELRQGFGTGEFVLAYQPKLHLPTGRILAVEALVRWHHPRHGMVPPDLFVPLAEETGNIRHLTRWALRTGIGQAAAWHAAGIDVQVAINLSARDLGDSGLPAAVAALLQEAGAGTGAISLEVTESAIMADPAAAIAVLREFRERGIGAAIDDFGVGQTSLAYLRSLPIREIKIDKTFVQRITDDEDDRKIVRSVIDLGHSLGHMVSVEGVEDAATLAILASLGCDHAQGYYIARPLVAEALAAFVRQSPPLVPSADVPA
jgi:diguanylate cyclase (GGDEF)-like protein